MKESVIYGRFENGFLRTISLEPFRDRYEDENGEIQERTVTVEDQAIRAQEQGFKPVDDIDESILAGAPVGKVVIFEPVDLEDHIGYTYKTVTDIQYFKREIAKCKQQLNDTDYKVTKCYEASLVGDPMPYDIQELRTTREAARARINILEEQLNEEVKK